MGTVEVITDPQRNLLRTNFRGAITPATMQAGATNGIHALATLRAHFTVLADLTDVATMEIDCVPHLTRLMDAFLASGVGRVIRVIPDRDKDIGFNLLSLTHYRGKVPIQTCASRVEAETILGQLAQTTPENAHSNPYP